VNEALTQEKSRLEAQVEPLVLAASQGFDTQIEKAEADLVDVERTVSDLASTILELESEYQVMMERAKESGDGNVFPDTEVVVATILAENRRKAAEAHVLWQMGPPPPNDLLIDDSPDLELRTDPKFGKSVAQWWQETKLVTGFANALYTQPSDNPYYEHNKETHNLLAPIITEFVRDRNRRLMQEWTELAVEYEGRREVFLEKMEDIVKVRVPVERPDIIPKQTGPPVLESRGARPPNPANPYRRKRRGDEARSDYEQEQIIAQLAAKEAMEQRITFGKVDPPRQIGDFEKRHSAMFRRTFNSHRVDPAEEEEELRHLNVWTDMEKCIFLDRFLQHPKDFRKIASFLRNKSTRDCVEFYYNSKKTVPYKLSLKEHVMRRKRRGDYDEYESIMQAGVAVGAIVESEPGEDTTLAFKLPSSDATFFTHQLHPLREELFSVLHMDSSALKKCVELCCETQEDTRKRKRSKVQQRKILRTAESLDSIADTSATLQSRNASDDDDEPTDGDKSSAFRKTPQKWSSVERKAFIDTLNKHGRNWALLAESVGTKTISQIKNYYYDYKKTAKGRATPDDGAGSDDNAESAVPGKSDLKGSLVDPKTKLLKTKKPDDKKQRKVLGEKKLDDRKAPSVIRKSKPVKAPATKATQPADKLPPKAQSRLGSTLPPNDSPKANESSFPPGIGGNSQKNLELQQLRQQQAQDRLVQSEKQSPSDTVRQTLPEQTLQGELPALAHLQRDVLLQQQPQQGESRLPEARTLRPGASFDADDVLSTMASSGHSTPDPAITADLWRQLQLQQLAPLLQQNQPRTLHHLQQQPQQPQARRALSPFADDAAALLFLHQQQVQAQASNQRTLGSVMPRVDNRPQMGMHQPNVNQALPANFANLQHLQRLMQLNQGIAPEQMGSLNRNPTSHGLAIGNASINSIAQIPHPAGPQQVLSPAGDRVMLQSHGGHQFQRQPHQGFSTVKPQQPPLTPPRLPQQPQVDANDLAIQRLLGLAGGGEAVSAETLELLYRTLSGYPNTGNQG
jgi:Myb-like DNA-binding domain